jgi:DNA primase
MNPKDHLKEHISIYEVAALYVNLKESGKNYKALCPFHSEKTPSFYIFPEKNTFSCFGCNKFGDIFTLVEEMENISFVEAMHFLAERFHITIEKGRKPTGDKNVYVHINELAQTFFQDCLAEDPDSQVAREYIAKRGLTPHTIEEYAIGYAPQRWDGLYTFLQKKGADLAKAVELGLLVQSENKRVYDRFRGRLMFPIYSDAGTLLAFGGRTLFDDPAKYINSPDSPIYHKGEHLFGLNLAKEAIRQHKAAILVEGYMDQVAMFQGGLTHTVAVLGTGLTEKQINKVKRFADDIFLFYDADTAGINAALRGIEKMFEQNVNPRILVTPDNKDPDELISKHGSKPIHELIAQARSGFHFLLNHAASAFDQRKPEKKKQAIDWVMASVSRFGDELTRDEYRKQVAEFFRVEPRLLKLAPVKATNGVEAAQPLKLSLDERNFIQAVLRAPQMLPQLREFFTPELYAMLQGRNIIQAIFAQGEGSGEIRLNTLAGRLSPAENAVLHDIYRSIGTGKADAPMLEKNAVSCILTFRKKLERHIIQEINREIGVAEREQNTTRIHDLMQKKYAYQQAKKKIREDRID